MGIRPATIEDLSAIMDIIADAKQFIKTCGCPQWNTPDGYPTRSTLLTDIEKKQLYVYDENGLRGIMACVFGKEPSYEKIYGTWLTHNVSYMTIHRLAVKKSYHHTGTSFKLFNYAEQLAKKFGAISIRVDTHPLNIAMQKFLLKHNFTKCGEINITTSKIDTLRIAYEKLL